MIGFWIAIPATVLLFMELSVIVLFTVIPPDPAAPHNDDGDSGQAGFTLYGLFGSMMVV